MQVSEANPLVGLEGRSLLLLNLSKALKLNPEFFGTSARPGNLVGSSHLFMDDAMLLMAGCRLP